MIWRILDERDNPRDAYTNMAMDTVLMKSVSEMQQPILRLYRFAGNGAVTLRIKQDLRDISTEECDRRGIEYVRRPTGGRALYHSPEDFTYCFIYPTASEIEFRRIQLGSIYPWLVESLKKLEIDVVHNKKTSLIIGERKISGNSSYHSRELGVGMQHGSVFYKIYPELLSRIHRIDNLTETDFERLLTAINQQSSASIEKVFATFFETFAYGRKYELSQPSSIELERIQESKLLYTAEKDTLSYDDIGNRGSCTAVFHKLDGSVTMPDPKHN